jgi:hypothetical protein
LKKNRGAAMDITERVIDLYKRQNTKIPRPMVSTLRHETFLKPEQPVNDRKEV